MPSPVVLEKALNASFQRAVSDLEGQSGANPSLVNIATQIPSSSSYEKYGWLGSVPSVREWLGAKRVGQLEDHDFTIRNKDFEVTIKLGRNDVEDDNIGAHQVRIRDLVQRVSAHPQKLISDLLINGDTGLAYDGVAFFSNVSGDRTIDNLLGGTGVTLAQIQADIQSAITAMMSFSDEAGEPLNIMPNAIVCPVARMFDIQRAVMSAADPTASGGVETFNPLNGKFTVIGDARLDADDANDYYVLATQYALRPFILQVRQQARPEMERIPLTKDWAYSGIMRGNAGYGLPHLAVKIVNS
jgi:phage major head subunit gpT-like protein